MVIAELSDSAKTLFAELGRIPCCLMILHFLRSNASTLLTADDVAYHLAKPLALVEKGLATLAHLDLVQSTTVTGITFYRFATHPAHQSLAHELCAWQDRWETRLKQIAHLIWGTDSSSTYVVPIEASNSKTWIAPIEKQNPSWASSVPDR
jgi:DNA-binding IclR family transcriptional regulator